MLSKEAIDRIVDLAPDPEVPVGMRMYTARPLHLIEEPRAQGLAFTTLMALVHYLRSQVDKLPEKVALHVSWERAMLFGSLNHDRKRETFAFAECLEPAFPFGMWMQHEDAMIKLQAQFVPTKERHDLLALLGNVTGEEVQTRADDGVTQTVSARAGVTLKNRVDVPNPVTLRPFRTFREVDQPESPFILRVKEGGNGPLVALFEADGGAWKLQAIRSVANWLAEHVGDVPIYA